MSNVRPDPNVLSQHESEQLFRLLTENAPVLIWVAGADKLCYWFNKVWLDFTGRTVEQEIGNGWTSTHPDDLQRCIGIYTEHFDRREPFKMEYRLKRHDGEYRWITESGVARYADDGTFEGYIGSCIDITEMHQLQDRLQASHDLLDKLAQNVPGAIYQFKMTPDGHASFPYVSAGFAEIYEITPEQARKDAAPVFANLHKDDYDRVITSIQESKASLQIWNLEYRVNLPKKGVRWMLGQSRPKKLEDGSILWHGYTTDITERKQTEIALSRSQSMMSAILENVSAYIYLKDISGRYLFANQQVLNLFGATADEVVGFGDEKFFNAKSVEQLRANDSSVLVDGKTLRIEETHLVTATGESATYWSVKLPLRHPDGSIYALCGISTDITERKQTEELLRASETRYQDLVQGLDAIVWEADAATFVFTFVSQRAEEMLGYPVERWLREPGFWASLIHPDDREQTIAFCRASTAQESDHTFDYRAVTMEGRVVWLHDIVRVVRDESGRVRRLRGVIMDITERKQAEELMRVSEEHLRAIIDTNPECIKLVGADGRLIEMNAAGLAMIEADSLDQVIHAPLLDLLLPSHREAFETLTESVLQGNKGMLVFEIQGLKGTRRWLETRAVPMTMRTGETVMLGITIDITERKKTETALLAESKKNEALLQAAGDGIHVLDLDGTVVQVNDAFSRMLGYTPKEMIGMNVLQWDAKWEPEELRLRMVDHMSRNETFETRHRHRDGHIFDVEVNVVGVEIGGNKLVFCASRDITERKQAEEKLQLAASVFTHAREGILITDATGTIVDVNATFTHITGYDRDEAIGQNPRILKSGLQGLEFYASMWQALNQSGQWSGELWNRRKDGEVYVEQLNISAVRDGQGKIQNYVGLFTDITHMKLHQQQLEHIAHYDKLTNLPNRVLLADRLEQAMVQSLHRNQSLAVVFLDLDGFKKVNDEHGHNVGDKLLMALAKRMALALRDGDTLARIGGDEFAVILVDMEHGLDAEHILNRLLQATSAELMVGNVALQVSASIGVTYYPQDGADADQLMRHADQAMYLSKQSGKNRYHLFDVASASAIQMRRESLNRILSGLHRNEFVLYYQPKVNMRTGAVVGAEALIRWQHPERGLLPPIAFLPVIEDHPVSVEVGEWVIETALKQIAQWQAAGLTIPVSVNISAYQLQKDNFATRLSQILAAHPEVKPASLELEILETSALEDVIQIAGIMCACHAIGVRFAIDDFGTGYSSLTYLKRLPADTLKIDLSFVRDMLDDPDDLAIVDGIVGLATAFRRQVIAEGVETIAHGELLLPLGCELVQGYGIARPMPAADFPEWAATWQSHPAWTVWHDRTPNCDDLAVAFAEVEHRHWLKALASFIDSELTTPPQDARKFHFVQWQKAEGLARYGDHPVFLVVVDMHDRVQRLGRQLIDLSIAGETLKAKTLLGEIHGLSDEVIALLKGLVRGG